MNSRNTAIKRIQADVRELMKHPSSRYHASPMEDNMFEWHFTIRGPVGSEFENGVYHGKEILLHRYESCILWTCVRKDTSSGGISVQTSACDISHKEWKVRDEYKDMFKHICLSRRDMAAGMGNKDYA